MSKNLKELTHIEAIRVISGIHTPEANEMSDRLSLINLLVRNMLGDAEDDFTNEQMEKCGIKLIREIKKEEYRNFEEFCKSHDEVCTGCPPSMGVSQNINT